MQSQPLDTAVPTAAPSEVQNAVPPPLLWNPNAAGLWSILLTPTFGAWLHMKNWQALGEAQKARQSLFWVWGNVAMILSFVIVGLLLPTSALVDSISRGAGIGVLVGWWQILGRQQKQRVAARYGKHYPRRGWAAPLVAAALVIAATFALAFVVVLIGELQAGGIGSAARSPRM